MSAVLIVAESRQGELRDVSRELVTAATALGADAGAPVVAALIGADPALAEGLALDGVDEVVTVASPVEHFDANVSQAALEALIADLEPGVVLLAQSVDSLGFAPAVAARGGHGYAGDVIQLAWKDGLIAKREAYGGKLEAEVGFPGRATTIVLLRPGTRPAAAGASAVPPIREFEVAGLEAATTHHGYESVAAGDVDITKAELILAIGRGVSSEDEIPEFEALAERMSATLCASRPLVDAGWIPPSRQVGQSGKTVAPKVYLAFGISGAAQHLAGIRGAETVIAVNTDPDAPIFSAAHYGAVADVFDIAEALAERSG